MIQFTKHSGIYTLEAVQELPVPLDKAWDFFTDPKNLQKITPPHMGFKITSVVKRKAYAGQIITYTVGILPGIRSNWVTEITQVKEQEFFIDEQRFGPYRMWHHEHGFEALPNGGTRMIDKVSYKLPMGVLGHIAHGWFVKKQLKGIFNYRFQTLEKLFHG